MIYRPYIIEVNNNIDSINNITELWLQEFQLAKLKTEQLPIKVAKRARTHKMIGKAYGYGAYLGNGYR